MSLAGPQSGKVKFGDGAIRRDYGSERRRKQSGSCWRSTPHDLSWRTNGLNERRVLDKEDCNFPSACSSLCLECPTAHSSGLQQHTCVGISGTLHFSWISLWSTEGDSSPDDPRGFYYHSGGITSCIQALRTSVNAARYPHGFLLGFFQAVASDPHPPTPPPLLLVSFHAWPFGEAVNSPAFRCGLAARCVNGCFFSSAGLKSCSRAARARDRSSDVRVHTSCTPQLCSISEVITCFVSPLN